MIWRGVKIAAFLLAAALAALAADAEVFTLWPWHGRADKSAAGRAPAAVAELPGWSGTALTQKIDVNGVELELAAGRSNATFAELAEWTARRFGTENLTLKNGTLRLAFKRPDALVERWLLVDGGPGTPVTIFCAAAPEKMPSPESWPPELPALPTGAKPVQVIRFKSTGAVYGAFFGAVGDRTAALRGTAAELRGANWVAAANESGSPGGGEIFLHYSPPRVMLVNFGADGAGSFYVRERNKNSLR